MKRRSQTDKKSTPSMVCEVPLTVTPREEAVLLSRLEAGRQFYNACLGEALKRLKLVRQAKNYRQARLLKASDPQRKVLFKKAREEWNFSDFSIQKYGTQIRNSWLEQHLDAHTAQKLATRAYLAAEKMLFEKAKKVRFKGKNQLDSLESKSNIAGIRWRSESLEWSGLKLSAIIQDDDPVLIRGLSSKIKYVRLVRRKRNGKNFFSAQLICQNQPFKKPKNTLEVGDVGLDLGPSVRLVGVAKVEIPETLLTT